MRPAAPAQACNQHPAVPIPATLRPLGLEDLPGLLAVQRACYGDALVESAPVYAQRIASPVALCWVAVAPVNLQTMAPPPVLAYVAAYATQLGSITPLHGAFAAAGVPDTLYLHDMAVHPQHASQGLARALLMQLRQQASTQWPGLGHGALVSVQGSQAYWQRQGYSAQPVADRQQQRNLASYGPGAVYMVQRLGT